MSPKSMYENMYVKELEKQEKSLERKEKQLESVAVKINAQLKTIADEKNRVTKKLSDYYKEQVRLKTAIDEALEKAPDYIEGVDDEYPDGFDD